MSLTKVNLELSRDLQSLASDLKWSAGDMMRIAEHLSTAGNEPDAWALLKICKILQAGEGKLNGFADEVKSGRIQRQWPV
jgi:hypothetical protein